MLVEQVRWWRPVSPGAAPMAVEVQIRHRHTAQPALVEPLDGGRARVRFTSPERAVAPGQAAVFYEGDRVLGGGFIASA